MRPSCHMTVVRLVSIDLLFNNRYSMPPVDVQRPGGDAYGFQFSKAFTRGRHKPGALQLHVYSHTAVVPYDCAHEAAIQHDSRVLIMLGCCLVSGNIVLVIHRRMIVVDLECHARAGVKSLYPTASSSATSTLDCA